MDLFTPVVSKSKFHHNFKKIFGKSPNEEAVINKWAEGFIDRDDKFPKEFQTTFNSSFWELYLFASLKELGYSVDFNYQAPDFVVTSPHQSFCIEATIANNVQDSPEEWQRNYNKRPDVQKVLDFSTIRISNALKSKYDKYIKSYSKLEHVKGKAFVIAIAPFEQPFFFIQNQQAMRRVLYGYDIPDYEDIDGKRIVYGHKYLDSIKKTNETQLPLGYFTKGEMNEVSAVIFSNTATFSKVRALSKGSPSLTVNFEVTRFNNEGKDMLHDVIPKPYYKESVLDGLNIFYNPNAEIPLDPLLFEDEDIIKNTYDILNQTMLTDARQGALIQRISLTHRNKLI